MKLTLSLPERPGLLHALPVFDLFLMLWLVFVLGSSLTRQMGVAVELPASRFELERYQETLVVTIAYGEPDPQLYFGRDAVSFEELQDLFKGLHDRGVQRDSIVLLRSDQSVPVGMQRRVEEMVLDFNFRVALLGADQAEEEFEGLKNHEKVEDEVVEPPSDSE